MTNRLQDKVCVITGTGGSRGRGAALRFAEEGALVVGCDTDAITGQETVGLLWAAGFEMISLHPADLGTMAGCQALVDLAVAEHGRIDVLFNNAAMAHFNWIEDITEEEWRHNNRDECRFAFNRKIPVPTISTR
ncbi:SDR family NAD(P)-dependent oxidoreductase [Rhizobium sp. GR12]|uniref:SDR family NAD(P)-dependent oxidoreductase n=1 Tax=Rhizobium sp. GR12 TaxID=3053925 RepID=UPI002FBEF8A5